MCIDLDDLHRDLFCSIVADMTEIAITRMPAQFCHIPVSEHARKSFAEFVGTSLGIAALCALDGVETPFTDPRETTNGEAFYNWLARTPTEEKNALVSTYLNSKFGQLL